jgi:hypothetical protein
MPLYLPYFARYAYFSPSTLFIAFASHYYAISSPMMMIFSSIRHYIEIISHYFIIDADDATADDD